MRKAAIEFLGTLFIYVGAPIRMFFEEEKAALLQQIDSEFEKLKDEKPPAPTRRFKGDEEEEEDDSVEGGVRMVMMTVKVEAVAVLSIWKTWWIALTLGNQPFDDIFVLACLSTYNSSNTQYLILIWVFFI